MAVTGSTEFDVNATPEQVMDAVAAIESLPERSSAHQSAEVESRVMTTVDPSACAPR